VWHPREERRRCHDDNIDLPVKATLLPAITSGGLVDLARGVHQHFLFPTLYAVDRLPCLLLRCCICTSRIQPLWFLCAHVLADTLGGHANEDANDNCTTSAVRLTCPDTVSTIMPRC
jgi:hypothetical protein